MEADRPQTILALRTNEKPAHQRQGSARILALDRAYVNAMLDGETTLPVDVEAELKKIANKRIWTIANIVGYLKQKDEEQYGHLTTGISADAAKVLLINYFKDNNISWENAAKENYIPNNGLEQA
mmetsp:Transcript_13151/g.21881  ORF Transcript_13151/g.21881 Transcript_13151/m.21881 type:complete len:125 (+) Transcript_13151:633-1007(+)